MNLKWLLNWVYMNYFKFFEVCNNEKKYGGIYVFKRLLFKN